MRGNAHQIQQCRIGPDGKLYVNVGNGDQTRLSRNMTSLQGKILRLNLDGSAPEDNPFFDATAANRPANDIFASGFRNPFGMAWNGNTLFVDENGILVDRVSRVQPGTDVGYDGTDVSMRLNALFTWGPPAVGPVGMTFVQDSGFPVYKRGHLFMGLIGATEEWPTLGSVNAGREIQELIVDAQGRLSTRPTTFVKYMGKGAMSLVGVASGPDGLYFTEYPVGNTPTASRVLKVVYAPGSATLALPTVSTGSQVFQAYGCRACHMLNGVGGQKGPDLTNLAETLPQRLQSASYVQQSEALLGQMADGSRRSEALRQVLAAQGDARSRSWFAAHVRDPGFDNPQAQMPASDIPDAQMEALTTFLLNRQAPSWISSLRGRGGLWVRNHMPLAVAGFGAGMFGLGVVLAGAAVAIGARRRRGHAPRAGA
jgi:hypothetical protein